MWLQVSTLQTWSGFKVGLLMPIIGIHPRLVSRGSGIPKSA
jgi:hypothetical protein